MKERTLDEKKGDDVDGIVNKKEIYLEVPTCDNVHEEYVIITKRPMIGSSSVSSIEARDYFEGRAGDGKYAIHSLGFVDIDI